MAVISNPVDQTITYYVDGKHDRTVTSSGFEANKGGFRIGNHKADKDAWNGKIDEMYLYRNILTAEEIQSVMNNSSPSGIESSGSSQDFRGVILDPVNRIARTIDGTHARNISVYAPDGRKIKDADDANSIRLSDLDKGIYLVSAITPAGTKFSTKISLN